ncbi:centromere protein T [Cheilinus undulatus]|uniref:centromere protein T n=1 Tax=Cheilinus undulatus TaxID=241271 RepID=UPI001BD5EC42|nr:centromere protein T [Cheilinus undulatus]
MDHTEDLSARVLLKHILTTEPPRTPITRSASKASLASTSATRRSNRQANKDAGAHTPQDILRRSLRHKMRESITRKSMPPLKRRTASVVLKMVDTPAPASMLLDDGDTPRHILMNILQTEPVRTPVVHDKAASEPQELQPPSANSSIASKRQSTELSGFDLPDLTISNVISTADGLSRKRPRRSLNVTAFEKRLREEGGVEEQNEESLRDDSSLSSTSSTSLSLKTPYVGVHTEKRGLQRRVVNRRKITEEEFEAAVDKWHMGGASSFMQAEHGLSETAYSEGFTLGLSKLSEPDITTDIVHCNTALYAKPDSTTTNYSMVATQDKPTLMASQLQRQMLELEQGELRKEKSLYTFPAEEEAVAEHHDEKCLSGSEKEEGREPDNDAVGKSVKEKVTAESQVDVKGDTAESMEELNVVEVQIKEEEAADLQTEEEGGEINNEPEEDVANGSQIEEEQDQTDSQSLEEEGVADSQAEEEDAVDSQAEEEEIQPDSQSQEEEEEEQVEEEEKEESVVKSQTEDEEQEDLDSQAEEEEIQPDSQSQEEEEEDEEQLEEEEKEKSAVGSQTEDEEQEDVDSQAEEEEIQSGSQIQEEEEKEECAIESQTEEDVVDSQAEEEEIQPDSQSQQEEEGESAVESQAEEDKEEDAADSLPEEEEGADQEIGEENGLAETGLSDSKDEHNGEEEEDDVEQASAHLEGDVEHISRRAHHSEGGPVPITEAEGHLADVPEARLSDSKSKAQTTFDVHNSLEMGSHESGLHVGNTNVPDSSTHGQTSTSLDGAEPDADKENSFHPEVTHDIEDKSPEEAAAQEEEWEDEEDDDEETEDIPSKTPAFVRQKRSLFHPDPQASPSVLKNIQASTSDGEGSSAPKPKQVRKRRTEPTRRQGLPKGYLMGIFKHFAKTKVSADVYPVLQEIMDKFFERLAEDLQTYAIHAKRKTIEVEDVELLLKRQGHVNDRVPVEVLIEKYLRMDQRRLLIPIATSGNVVIPKNRR